LLLIAASAEKTSESSWLKAIVKKAEEKNYDFKKVNFLLGYYLAMV
jgi:uncharacterized alpha/beta hydrolase family protein